MNDNRKLWRRIFIKTSIVFLAFYIVIMSVITYLYSYDIRNSRNNSMILASDNIRRGFEDVSSHYEGFEFVDILSNLSRSYLGAMPLNASISDIYLSAILLDSNKNIVSKSGNCLTFEDPVLHGKYKVDYTISLDKYMSRDQSNLFYEEVYKKYEGNNSGKSIDIKGEVTAYISNQDILPKKIILYTGPSGSKEVQFDFDTVPPDDARLFSEKLDSIELFIKSIGKDNKLTQTDIERYEFCDKLATDTSNSIANNTWHILNKLTIRDKVYYLAIGGQYFPLEITVNSLIPLYIFVFVVLVVLVLILSSTLYKTNIKEKQLENNRRELTNAIAHELKTPLGIIRSFSEGIKEKIAEDKKDYYLDVIIDETEQMDKMVLEMLDLSKLEANAYKLKLEQFSLKELTTNKLDRFKNIIDEKKIHIDFICDDEYPIVADYAGFEQIISNFISNAINHTPLGKIIKISIVNLDRKVLFSIENQGETIPEAQLQKIWDSFYKVDNARERASGGTGLGLAIAKCYLELHKAEYGCENTDDGVRFWFCITIK